MKNVYKGSPLWYVATKYPKKNFVRGLPLGYISATLDDIGFERRFSYLLFLPHFLSKSSKRFLISNNFVCHIFFKELFFGALFSTLAINNCTRGLPLGVVAYKLLLIRNLLELFDRKYGRNSR